MLGSVSTSTPGPLSVGALARISFSGAEATVAIGLSRLGHACAWIGRVGADDFGVLIRAALRAEGVDVSAVRVVDDAPTALMLKTRRTSDRTRVSYARRSSAGSQLRADDVPAELVRSARVLHVTGITPALGPGPAAAVARAIELARDGGALVSVDVNHRPALWSVEAARATLEPLFGSADLVFAGDDELSLLHPAADGTPDRAARALLERGVREVVVKNGAAGATCLTADGLHTCPAPPAVVVDPVGAGDCFVAGYLSALLDGLPVAQRLERGCVLGAISVATAGDWEGLPRREELTSLTAVADVLR